MCYRGVGLCLTWQLSGQLLLLASVMICFCFMVVFEGILCTDEVFLCYSLGLCFVGNSAALYMNGMPVVKDI